jgi:hypothetical protein
MNQDRPEHGALGFEIVRERSLRGEYCVCHREPDGVMRIPADFEGPTSRSEFLFAAEGK